MSKGLVEQGPPVQVAEIDVKSSPYGEIPGELLDPAAIVMSHPLRFELEYVAAPVPGTVMVVEPLTTCIESAAAKEAVEAASKRHKNNFLF
jgi:hypothetical protein